MNLSSLLAFRGPMEGWRVWLGLCFVLLGGLGLSEAMGQAKPGIPPVDEHRTLLTDAPNWRLLEPLQGSMPRAEFERVMDEIYSDEFGGWRSLFRFDSERRGAVRMDGHRPDLWYRLDFGERVLSPQERGWRTPQELGPAPENQPLQGMRIVIDPGHIGGKWAKMEGRWFQIGNAEPVREGMMTLAVGQRMRRLLEEQGAQVALLRTRLEPVTPLRVPDLDWVARKYYETVGVEFSEALMVEQVTRVFIRIAEIRARARRIERSPLPPDLTICLHLNAAPWGNPRKPTLINGTHLHILVNGCYAVQEMQQDDQRAEMLWRALSRTHEVEIPLANAVAKRCAKEMRLRPYRYTKANARQAGETEYVWARNLLANRIFRSPVIYMEPYVMNSRQDYARIQAGAYEGTREFRGVERINIYDEYAQSVVSGVVDWYAQERGLVAVEGEGEEVEE